jgi:hypothetical protein
VGREFLRPKLYRREAEMRRMLLLAVPLLGGGCTTQMISSGEMASVAPVLSVERFLQSANEGDLHSMARLFGTAKGPIIETGGTLSCGFKKLGSWFGLGTRCETLQEVEIRMDAIAQIIRHEDYIVVSEANVPGRINPTTRIGVDMRVEGRDITDVPFVVVRTDEGRWLVEEIGLTRITRGEAGA